MIFQLKHLPKNTTNALFTNINKKNLESQMVQRRIKKSQVGHQPSPTFHVYALA